MKGGLTRFRAWCCGLLLPAMLGGCGFGWAQDLAPADPALPPRQVLQLGDQQQAISLSNLSQLWIDSASQQTADALEAADDKIAWSPFEADLSHNIDGKALWVRFEAVNQGQQRWFLELGSSGVDRAQLFYRAVDGHWVVQEAGDSRMISEWPLPGRLPTFELAARTSSPVRYWLRVEHERVDFASPMRIVDQRTLLASREAEQFLLGGYFSVALLIALMSAANAITSRDRSFAAYAIYVVALAASQLAYLGIGAQHVWNSWQHWNELSAFVLPGISGAVGLWFAKVVTEPARYSRALDLTVWALIAALLSAVAMDAFVVSRQSFQLVVTLTGVALVVIAALIALVWIQGHDAQVRLMALGFLPVLVMALFPLARGLNLIPISGLTRYGAPVGAAVAMPILYFALSLRGSRRREAHMRATGLSLEDTLTGLAHKGAFLQRLEGALARSADLKQACALLGVKIANYEAIISEYGRDTAERALVVATSMLRNVTTDMDMAARVGDHQFALLLEGPATPQQATSRAQQLVARGLRDSPALPPGLVLKFQVAVALLPAHNLGASASLNWLIDTVNSEKPDARKLIRALNF